ncbi:MAG: hypothetical protein EON59_04495 [Alphaproteobacteria bacterium]|nr:MAG: hypothetical protein EON59_04495 [Alphaproteobacteria bacterium]
MSEGAESHFQFKIIEGLSESIRELAKSMSDMQRTQVGMLERLAKLEANRVGEVVGEIKVTMDSAVKRIDVLEQDKDRRDGAGSFLGGVFKYGPTVFSLLTLLYLFGRSIGFVPAPPTTATVPAPMQIERRDGPREEPK